MLSEFWREENQWNITHSCLKSKNRHNVTAYCVESCENKYQISFSNIYSVPYVTFSIIHFTNRNKNGRNIYGNYIKQAIKW
jgi:hypothetical protein